MRLPSEIYTLGPQSIPITLNCLIWLGLPRCMCAKSLYSCPILRCLVAQLCPTLLTPYGLQPARLLCPWDSPGKNTGAGCHAFLQEIFPTQGLNLTGSVLKNLPANAGDAGNTGSIPGTIKKAGG